MGPDGPTARRRRGPDGGVGPTAALKKFVIQSQGDSNGDFLGPFRSTQERG